MGPPFIFLIALELDYNIDSQINCQSGRK